MQYCILAITIGVLTATAAGEPVQYDQIPADAVSYFSADIQTVMTSRLSQIPINGVTVRQQIESPDFQYTFGGPVTSWTIYALGKDGQLVLLLHASADKFRQEVENRRATDTTIFQYAGQDVHFSSSCLIPELFGSGAAAHSNEEGERSFSSIGLGGSASMFRGAFYTAYVRRDLIVLSIDLPAMAEAIDVLNGKKTSLANRDPHGLKIQPPSGAFIVGAGLSANWRTSNLSSYPTSPATRPVTISQSGPGVFGGELFGSFKGKAQIARFYMGENDRDEFANASITMTDPDAAQQLKNLLLGIKALVSLSQEQQRPFIDPLEINSTDNDVTLHWAMPTEKLFAAVHQAAQGQMHDDSMPANSPATQPAH